MIYIFVNIKHNVENVTAGSISFCPKFTLNMTSTCDYCSSGTVAGGRLVHVVYHDLSDQIRTIATRNIIIIRAVYDSHVRTAIPTWGAVWLKFRPQMIIHKYLYVHRVSPANPYSFIKRGFSAKLHAVTVHHVQCWCT